MAVEAGVEERHDKETGGEDGGREDNVFQPNEP